MILIQRFSPETTLENKIDLILKEVWRTSHFQWNGRAVGFVLTFDGGLKSA